jgi:hypothetical protein
MVSDPNPSAVQVLTEHLMQTHFIWEPRTTWEYRCSNSGCTWSHPGGDGASEHATTEAWARHLVEQLAGAGVPPTPGRPDSREELAAWAAARDEEQEPAVADEYIPTTEQIRQGYAGNATDRHRLARLVAFGHWLFEHDRKLLLDYEARRLPSPMRIEKIDGVTAESWLDRHDERVRAEFRPIGWGVCNQEGGDWQTWAVTEERAGFARDRANRSLFCPEGVTYRAVRLYAQDDSQPVLHRPADAATEPGLELERDDTPMAPLDYITPEEGAEAFDAEARRRAGVSGGEMLAALNNGTAEDRFGHSTWAAMNMLRCFLGDESALARRVATPEQIAESAEARARVRKLFDPGPQGTPGGDS